MISQITKLMLSNQTETQIHQITGYELKYIQKVLRDIDSNPEIQIVKLIKGKPPRYLGCFTVTQIKFRMGERYFFNKGVNHCWHKLELLPVGCF